LCVCISFIVRSIQLKPQKLSAEQTHIGAGAKAPARGQKVRGCIEGEDPAAAFLLHSSYHTTHTTHAARRAEQIWRRRQSASAWPEEQRLHRGRRPGRRFSFTFLISYHSHHTLCVGRNKFGAVAKAPARRQKNRGCIEGEDGLKVLCAPK